jgi:hypothetical protein
MYGLMIFFQFSDVVSLTSIKEGFTIKWRHFVNSKKYSLKNDTKLKS